MTRNVEAKKPSRITIPEKANPHARLVYQLMRDNGVTYSEIEWRSGVLASTLKSYRLEKTPSLQSIEALLGSFGWTLVPVPPLSSLKPEVLEAIEDISLNFVSDNVALAAVMARVCRIPIQPPDSEAVTPADAPMRPIRRPTIIEGQVALEFHA